MKNIDTLKMEWNVNENSVHHIEIRGGNVCA